MCFGTAARRSLLKLTSPVRLPPSIAKLSAPDRRKLRHKTIRALISAAETYLSREELQLNNLIDQLPEKLRKAAIREWTFADEEPNPIGHRRSLLRFQKSLSPNDVVRRKLQDVVAGRIGTQKALAHDWLPMSLQFGAHLAGITGLRGAAFGKWIIHRPAKLSEAAQAALDSPWFKKTRGRRDQGLITEYVAAIEAAYHGWTGRHLCPSSSVRSRLNAADVGKDLPGASLTFALGCLRPLFPDMTVAAASHHIRKSRKIKD